MLSKYRRAARLLSEGKKTKDVAALLGVHRSNLWRWQQRSDFQAYRAKLAREKAFKQMQEDMRTMRELSALLDNGNPLSVNLAANKLLALGNKYV